MHPDLSAPAANDRRERLTAAAELHRVLRTIGGRRLLPTPAVAVQILLHRWQWRRPANYDCGVALEHCSAKLAGQLE